MNNFYKELKRRNVVKAAISYAVGAWAILEVASLVFPLLNIPESTMRFLLIVLIVIFPAWIVFAWIYEYTPKGFRKTDEVPLEESVVKRNSKRMNAIIIGSLSLAVVLLLAERIFETTQNLMITDTEKSIAVLPFTNLTPNQENTPISNGIMQEILGRISALDEVRVISRQSVMKYANTDLSIAQIASELGVGFILEGTVQAVGDQIRINTNLIEATKEDLIWNQSFDGSLTQVFDFQAEIAKSVHNRLGSILDASQNIQVTRRPTENMLAYQLYLNGLEEINQYYIVNKQGRLNNAKAFFNQALKLDDTFLEAYAKLAWTYHLLGEYDIQNDSIIYYSKKALKLNPDFALPYAMIGRVYATLKLDSSEHFLLEAYNLNSNSTEINNILGWYYRYINQYDQSYFYYQKAHNLSPNNPAHYSNLSAIYARCQMENESKEILSAGLDKFPNDINILIRLGFHNLIFKKDPDILIEQFKRKIDSGGDVLLNIIMLARYHAYRGEYEEALLYYEKMKSSNLEKGEFKFANEGVRVNYAYTLKQLGQDSLAERYIDDVLERRSIHLQKDSPNYHFNFVALAYAHAYRQNPDSTVYWIKEWKNYGNFSLDAFTDHHLIKPLLNEEVIQQFVHEEQAKIDSMATNVRKMMLKG